MVATRIGLALDEATNDLFLASDGSLQNVTDAEAVGQHGRQRLQTHAGEWFLDTTCGVQWLSQILGRFADPALAEAVVKAELLETDGIEEITSFSVSFNQVSRGLIINEIEAVTMFDEVVTV
ncbi:hypothetical protein IWQ49_006362 [Labrenzia sp. EL_126]|nr:hypothetical protein [Labrenzia sp. EL_126]